MEDRMLSDEILLALIKKAGGGSGTDDYEDLKNKPQIGGVELSGNKSLSDLGIASAQSVSEITDGQEINSFSGVETALSNVDEAIEAIDGKIDDATTYDYADAITIEDAVPANLAECKVKIEPVQDLHGYDHPWVGGAGKNLYGGTFSTIFDFPRTLATGTTISISLDKTGVGDVTMNLYKANETTRYDFFTLSGTSRTVTLTGDTARVMFYADSGITAKNIQIEVGSTATSYEPYSNICPITGHTEASVEVTDGDETTNTYTIALGDTVYGGTVDFNTGVMTVTMAQIASYDGETIGEPWISDRDVYAEGVTPTTGAQVVYTLATPFTIQLTPKQIQLLKGTNTLTASTGDISVTVNGVSGAIGQVQEQVNDHEERIDAVESGLDEVKNTIINPFIIKSTSGYAGYQYANVIADSTSEVSQTITLNKDSLVFGIATGNGIHNAYFGYPTADNILMFPSTGNTALGMIFLKAGTQIKVNASYGSSERKSEVYIRAIPIEEVYSPYS